MSASRRRQARRQAATNIENDAPDDHSIGRSRGGLTTKIHALTERRHVPRSWSGLTAGQAGDNPKLVPLLDDYATACAHHGGAEPGADRLQPPQDRCTWQEPWDCSVNPMTALAACRLAQSCPRTKIFIGYGPLKLPPTGGDRCPSVAGCVLGARELQLGRPVTRR